MDFKEALEVIKAQQSAKSLAVASAGGLDGSASGASALRSNAAVHSIVPTAPGSSALRSNAAREVELWEMVCAAKREAGGLAEADAIAIKGLVEAMLDLEALREGLKEGMLIATASDVNCFKLNPVVTAIPNYDKRVRAWLRLLGLEKGPNEQKREQEGSFEDFL